MYIIDIIRRDTAISDYCSQLGLMERLKHELLLLHNKVSVNSLILGTAGDLVKPHKINDHHQLKKEQFTLSSSDSGAR